MAAYAYNLRQRQQQEGHEFQASLGNIERSCQERKKDRRRGPGTREKIRSKRINLEGNTHAQEINVSQLPV
jgi:hypothetical protein